MKTIVSIRIPKQMVPVLKDWAKDNHFLDVSEAVRSIVRKRWRESKDPSAFQIKHLREDIKEVISERTKTAKADLVLHELERIKEMLLSKEEQEQREKTE